MEDNITFATGPAQVSGAVEACKVPITQALDSETEGGREGSNQQQERKKENKYVQNNNNNYYYYINKIIY